ncbi:IFN protein, partial [Brachypteracias leptosomus]|nr:IFN protein [Brachypteracias leptosomus]
HPQQAAHTALPVLQHLFAILNASNIPQQWHTQARHQLLNSLHHSIHHLEQCLTDNAPLFQTQQPRSPLLHINKYFADIQHFLHARNHSACAWDHVRLQARACLRRLHNLTRTTR